MSGATGAAIGIGAAAVVGGTVGSVTSGMAQADAAQSAADQQYKLGVEGLSNQKDQFNASLNFATQSRDMQVQSRDKAVSLASMSPAELGQMDINLSLQDQAIGMQMQALKRNQMLLDSADPSIKEAGQQALQLLQGKQAASMQPVLDQRARQRSQMEQTLSSRLGPDYASSSAGAAALRNFDNDTSTMSNQIQQQTLGQLLGVAQNTSNSLNPVNQVGNAFSTLGSLNSYGLQASQNIIGRQVNAFTGNPVSQQLTYTPANYGPLMAAAGNSTIGAQMGAQTLGGAFNGAAGLGGTILGAGISNAMKPQTPNGNTNLYT